MSEPMISVIVPVYNTEKFLESCLKSLKAQTFSNYEVIMIDDGSTDRSGEICRKYVKDDFRFELISQRNSGVSMARNRGLDVARGKYIVFLDSDDVLPRDALSQMVNVEADLTIGSISEIDEHGELNGVSQTLVDQTVTREQILQALFDEELFGYQGYIGNKMFKRSIIEMNHIRFEPEVKYNEDRLFVLQYVIECTKIALLSSNVYYYRQRETSALAQTKKVFKADFITEIDAFERMKVAVKKDYPSLYRRISRCSFEKAIYWMTQTPNEYKGLKKKLRKYINDNAKICILDPEKGVLYKLKTIVHCMMKK